MGFASAADIMHATELVCVSVYCIDMREYLLCVCDLLFMDTKDCSSEGVFDKNASKSKRVDSANNAISTYDARRCNASFWC